jgi:hypothetical protein
MLQSARVTIKVSDRSKMDPTTNEREVKGCLGGLHPQHLAGCCSGGRLAARGGHSTTVLYG